MPNWISVITLSEDVLLTIQLNVLLHVSVVINDIVCFVLTHITYYSLWQASILEQIKLFDSLIVDGLVQDRS